MNKIEKQMFDAIMEVKGNGFTPKYMIIPKIELGIDSFLGVEIREEILYAKDGELVSIVFGVE